MTNHELESEIKRLISDERRITNDILRLINLAEDRPYIWSAASRAYSTG